MLVASTIDPALFDPNRYGALRGGDARAVRETKRDVTELCEHLYDAGMGHILVDDTRSRVRNSMKTYRETHPEGIPQEIEMAWNSIPECRWVEIAVRDADFIRLSECIPHEGSRVALLLPGCDTRIDASIVAPETRDAAEGAGVDLARVFDLMDYWRSPVHKRERDRRTAIPIGRRSKHYLLTEVLTPVLYWAKHVHLIDRYIGAASQENDNAQRDTSREGKRRRYDWGPLSTFILEVYRAWTAGFYKGQGKFEVITCLAQDDEGKKKAERLSPEEQRKSDDRRSDAATKQERSMTNRLVTLGCKEVRVRVKSGSRGRKAQHDRYIVTNQGIAVGFSSGLDTIGKDLCDEGDIYLRPLKEDDPRDPVTQWLGDDVVRRTCAANLLSDAFKNVGVSP